MGYVGKENSRAGAGDALRFPPAVGLWLLEVCGDGLGKRWVPWDGVASTVTPFKPGSPGAAVSPSGRTRMEMHPQPRCTQAEGFGASGCCWEPVCIDSSRAVCVVRWERLAATKPEVGSETSCCCPGGTLQPRPVQGLCWLWGCTECRNDVEVEQGSGAQANPKPVAVCVLPEASPPSLPWEQPCIPSCVCPVLGWQLPAAAHSSEVGDERSDVHLPGDGAGRENEACGGQSPLAPVAGNVDFENVLFRAQLQKPLLLRWVWVGMKPQHL